MAKLDKKVNKIKSAQQTSASPMGGRAGSVMTPGLDEGLVNRLSELERRFNNQQPSSPAMPPQHFPSARLDELERKIDDAVRIAKSANNARVDLVEHVEQTIREALAGGVTRDELRTLTERVDGLARDRASATVDEAALREIVGKVVQPLEAKLSAQATALGAVDERVKRFDERSKQLVDHTQVASYIQDIKTPHDQLKQAFYELDKRVAAATATASDAAQRASQSQQAGGPSAETLKAVSGAVDDLQKRMTSAEATLKKANIDVAAAIELKPAVAELKKKVERVDKLWPATFKQTDATELRKATQRLGDLTSRLATIDDRVTSVDARCTSAADGMTAVRADAFAQNSLTGSRRSSPTLSTWASCWRVTRRRPRRPLPRPCSPSRPARALHSSARPRPMARPRRRCSGAAATPADRVGPCRRLLSPSMARRRSTAPRPFLSPLRPLRDRPPSSPSLHCTFDPVLARCMWNAIGT